MLLSGSLSTGFETRSLLFSASCGCSFSTILAAACSCSCVGSATSSWPEAPFERTLSKAFFPAESSPSQLENAASNEAFPAALRVDAKVSAFPAWLRNLSATDFQNLTCLRTLDAKRFANFASWSPEHTPLASNSLRRPRATSALMFWNSWRSTIEASASFVVQKSSKVTNTAWSSPSDSKPCVNNNN